MRAWCHQNFQQIALLIGKRQALHSVPTVRRSCGARPNAEWQRCLDESDTAFMTGIRESFKAFLISLWFADPGANDGGGMS